MFSNRREEREEPRRERTLSLLISPEAVTPFGDMECSVLRIAALMRDAGPAKKGSTSARSSNGNGNGEQNKERRTDHRCRPDQESPQQPSHRKSDKLSRKNEHDLRKDGRGSRISLGCDRKTDEDASTGPCRRTTSSDHCRSKTEHCQRRISS